MKKCFKNALLLQIIVYFASFLVEYIAFGFGASAGFYSIIIVITISFLTSVHPELFPLYRGDLAVIYFLILSFVMFIGFAILNSEFIQWLTVDFHKYFKSSDFAAIGTFYGQNILFICSILFLVYTALFWLLGVLRKNLC